MTSMLLIAVGVAVLAGMILFGVFWIVRPDHTRTGMQSRESRRMALQLAAVAAVLGAVAIAVAVSVAPADTFEFATVPGGELKTTGRWVRVALSAAACASFLVAGVALASAVTGRRGSQDQD